MSPQDRYEIREKEKHKQWQERIQETEQRAEQEFKRKFKKGIEEAHILQAQKNGVASVTPSDISTTEKEAEVKALQDLKSEFVATQRKINKLSLEQQTKNAVECGSNTVS